MSLRAWEVRDAWGIEHLAITERSEVSPGPGQVAVRMKAASLNYRDLLTVKGKGGVARLPLVPFSDGVGDVIAVGEGVRRVAVGDRVCPLFFQSWMDGDVTAEKRKWALGGSLPGILQETVVLEADGVAKAPEHLTDEEAATLPCAALTAWRALVVEGGLRAGNTVLVQGTGGVSIFALQFAKALGATVIVTSSSDAKLARAKALGADHLINYRSTPEWDKEALTLTSGRGVDHVVEVGGKDTFNRSLEACRVGGRILVIGILSGATQQVTMPTMFSRNLRITGLSVGSREQFEAMTSLIVTRQLRPVIDRTFPFADVPDALRYMESGAHFGKSASRFLERLSRPSSVRAQRTIKTVMGISVS